MQRVDKIRKRRKVSQVDSGLDQKVVLRLGGVYALPDGKEVIAGVGRQGRYFLHHPLAWKISAWIVSLPIEFEIDAEGRVISHRGQPATWRVEDLIDTGRSLNRM